MLAYESTVAEVGWWQKGGEVVRRWSLDDIEEDINIAEDIDIEEDIDINNALALDIDRRRDHDKLKFIVLPLQKGGDRGNSHE